ncbi:MAG: cell division protein SepF [Candidatus Nanoarchaeia archaeon]|nr:cell division protein SepF [Candidatus Nanoarchaeia archaeon]
MKEAILKIKDKIMGSSAYDIPDEFGEDYLEVDMESQPKLKQKVIVRPYVVREFRDMQLPLNDLREGYTVALINVKLLKDKDVSELKRAVSTLKKTCNAINGDIAGFGDDWLVATPGFAQVFRPKVEEEQ